MSCGHLLDLASDGKPQPPPERDEKALIVLLSLGALPERDFFLFHHGTRFETMAILVKALKCATKRLRAFP